MLTKIQTKTATDRVAVDVAGTGYSRGPTVGPGLFSSLPILYTDLHLRQSNSEIVTRNKTTASSCSAVLIHQPNTYPTYRYHTHTF